MSKNFKQPGNVLTVAAPAAGFASGDLIQKNDLVGIATIAAISTGTQKDTEMDTKGVHLVPKEAPLVINQGDKVYAAFTNQKADPVNKTSSARVFVGWAAKDAVSAATTVELLLPLGGE